MTWLRADVTVTFTRATCNTISVEMFAKIVFTNCFFFFNTLFKTFFLEKFKRPGWHIFTSGLLRWKNEGIFQTRMEMRLHRNLNFAKDQSWPKISKFLSVHTNILIVCLCVNKTNFCFPGVTLCKWISFLPAKDSEDKVKNQGHKQYSR